MWGVREDIGVIGKSWRPSTPGLVALNVSDFHVQQLLLAPGPSPAPAGCPLYQSQDQLGAWPIQITKQQPN